MALTNVAHDIGLRLHDTPLATMLERVIARVNRARERARRYERTYCELAACSDRQLADMGFRRCDIRDIARRSADAV